MSNIGIGYTGTTLGDGPMLLTSFVKNWRNPQGDINWKWIKCRLWFANLEEIQEFVVKYQEVPNFQPIPFDKDNDETWTPYYTSKVKFEK